MCKALELCGNSRQPWLAVLCFSTGLARKNTDMQAELSSVDTLALMSRHITSYPVKVLGNSMVAAYGNRGGMGSDSAESETSSETRATVDAPSTSPSTVTNNNPPDAIAAITIKRKLRTPPQRRRHQELAVRQGALARRPQCRRVRLRDVESLAIRVHILHF